LGGLILENPRGSPCEEKEMEPMTTRYVYWQEDDMWLGYLEEFPDYWTQGESLQDLQEHLKDLHSDLSLVST
jgi:hypothetical protein